MTTTFAITTLAADTANRWEIAAATTLAGAKREAARKLGGGYLHHTLAVGIAHGGDLANVQTVATRPMAGGKWSTR